MLRVGVVVLLLGIGSSSWAATIAATTCSSTDVQTAITASTNGDTVTVPAGSCTWGSRVTWSNKTITVQGAGIGNTVITGVALFTITVSTANPFRLTGFTFTHASGEADETIRIQNTGTGTFTSGWRVDHNRFLYSNAGETMAVNGLTWGVIDHNTWDTVGYAAQVIYIYGYTDIETPPYGATYWNRPMNLGTDEAIYLEDNTINYAGSPDSLAGPPFVYDMALGGAVVVRHNVIHNAYIQTHSARTNDRGGKKYEIYNNVFTDMNGRFALKRSGSGVFFNNQVTGATTQIDIDSQHIPGVAEFSSAPIGICSSSNPYDGAIEANGWPCLDQPGRGGGTTGADEEYMPLYAWNNGTTSTCATGGACDNATTIRVNPGAGDLSAYLKATAHSNGQVDFVNNGSTAKPGYTAYTYPHPVAAAADVEANHYRLRFKGP